MKRVAFNEMAGHLESGDLYSQLSLIYLYIYNHIFPKGCIDAWLLVAVAIKIRQFYASFTFRQQPVLHWQMTKLMMRRQSERASEREREKKNKQTNENRRVRVCLFVQTISSFGRDHLFVPSLIFFLSLFTADKRFDQWPVGKKEEFHELCFSF